MPINNALSAPIRAPRGPHDRLDTPRRSTLVPHTLNIDSYVLVMVRPTRDVGTQTDPIDAPKASWAQQMTGYVSRLFAR